MSTTAVDLKKYGVSAERGFLPGRDPPRKLPKEFRSLEHAVQEMPAWLHAGCWGPTFEKIRIPKVDLRNYSRHMQEAIFRDLNFATAAYIWELWRDEKPRLIIPANIAVPLVAFADALGRHPCLAYTSYASYNWYRLDPSGPIEYRNLGLIRTFYGGLDESGFILPHVNIEARAGQAIDGGIHAKNAAQKGDVELCRDELWRILIALTAIVDTLKALAKNCDPYIYKERVRPFIFGTKEHSDKEIRKGIIYRGVEKYKGKPQVYRGETGAQSVIFPFLDAIMGIVHDATDELSVHLREMREYMQVEHRALLELVEKGASIRALALQHPELTEVYNACIKQMVAFRIQHYRFAKAYIFNQPSKRGEHANPHNVGTGGTKFDKSLYRHILDTRHALIKSAA